MAQKHSPDLPEEALVSALLGNLGRVARSLVAAHARDDHERWAPPAGSPEVERHAKSAVHLLVQDFGHDAARKARAHELLGSAEMSESLERLMVTATGDQSGLRTAAGDALEAFVSYWFDSPAVPSNFGLAERVARAAELRLMSETGGHSMRGAGANALGARGRALAAAWARAVPGPGGASKPPIATIDSFAAQLSIATSRRNRAMTMPGVWEHRVFPLEDVYVSPRIVDPGSAEAAADDEDGLEGLLQGPHRTVILGPPGSGKSVFLSWLALQLAAGSKRYAGRAVVPVLVTARDWGSAFDRSASSLLEYVAEDITARLQLDVPRGALDYLAGHGRMFMLIDGFDEILDPGKRRLAQDSIQALMARFPSMPLLITSREVGYSRVPLDDFRVLHLASFDRAQSTALVQNYFALVDGADGRGARSEALLRELELQADLRATPLLLALVCSLYRGAGYIPSNMPAIYETAADLMFNRWDRARGLYAPTSYETQLRPAIELLAFRLYQHPTGTISASDLVKLLTSYFHSHRFDDEYEARAAAIEIVDYLRGRLTLLRETGSLEDSEPLLQFSHRTFLEYFAAAYLVRTAPSPAQLNKVLRPHLAQHEWESVAMLSYQLSAQQQENAVDELIADLLAHAPSQRPDDLALAAFAARTLAHVRPSPRMTRRVVERAIATAINGIADADHADVDGLTLRTEHVSALSSVLAATSETRDLVAKTLEAALIDAISRGGPRARAAAAIAMNLEAFSESGCWQDGDGI